MRTKRVSEHYSTPRVKSAEEALSSLMALSARSEKSSGDARRLMSRWGVEQGDQQSILERLMSDKFIDDERYATAFIREKSNLNGWGRHKIVRGLQQKGITKEIIEERMEQMEETNDRERIEERLKEMVEKRLRVTKYKTKQQLREKLIRYGATLGYDFSAVCNAVQAAISNIKDEEDEECYDL